MRVAPKVRPSRTESNAPASSCHHFGLPHRKFEASISAVDMLDFDAMFLGRGDVHRSVDRTGNRPEPFKVVRSIVVFRSAMITVRIGLDRLCRHPRVDSIESAYRLIV
jgi:hypothetical protein